MNLFTPTQSTAHTHLPNRRMAIRLVPVVLALLAPSSFAHPGHAFLDQSPAHWVSHPDHALVLLAISILLCTIGRLTPRPLTRRLAYACSAVTLMLGIAASGILGS